MELKLVWLNVQIQQNCAVSLMSIKKFLEKNSYGTELSSKLGNTT